MKKMKTKYTVQFRRKRDQKTNYKKRLALLKSRKPRVVIRKQNKQIIIQLVAYEPGGDKILSSTTSLELKKQGWKHGTKNLPAAYLTGLLFASKAAKVKKEAVLDMGLQTPRKGSVIFSALKGVIDGGLKVPASEEIFPDESRIKGEHIASYLDKHKSITKDFEELTKKLK